MCVPVPQSSTRHAVIARPMKRSMSARPMKHSAGKAGALFARTCVCGCAAATGLHAACCERMAHEAQHERAAPQQRGWRGQGLGWAYGRRRAGGTGQGGGLGRGACVLMDEGVLQAQTKAGAWAEVRACIWECRCRVRVGAGGEILGG